MANSKGNMEIMDVLSSIRRLVSEDRPSATARAEPTPPAPVADKAEQAQVAPLPPDAAEAVPVVAPAMSEAMADDLVLAAMAAPRAPDGAARRPGESRFVLTAALRVGEEAEREDDPDGGLASESLPQRADLKPARDLSSLEDTIAELEAAVAGIEEEFEPDGGDAPAHADLASAGPMPSWPVAERAAPVAGGFQGIMAGFETMPVADDRLDLPINGDVTVPAMRRGEDRQVGVGGGFFRAAARAEDATREVPEDIPAEATPPTAEDIGFDGASQTEAPFAASEEDLTVAPVDGEEERAVSRPIILRSRSVEPEPAPAEGRCDDAAAVRLEAVAEAATAPESDLQAESADLTVDGRDIEAEEEHGLFDPLADADLDIDMLRDMVAEIVRDELRGTLGERITRNLRALVRREIERALIAEGLKRD